MKVWKKSLAFLTAVLLTMSLGGCRLSNDLTGSDYITYYNGDRAAIIGDYVGSKIKDSKDMLSDVQARIEHYSGSLSYVYIDNNNSDYFYNGVVIITGPTEKLKVNVWMLAPGCDAFCMVKLEKDNPEDCKLTLSGNFYEYNQPAWEMVSGYQMSYEDRKVSVFFDAGTIDETLMKQTADIAYANETLRNSSTVMYYYLYASGYTDASDYEYYFYVNISQKEITVYDKTGNTVREFTY